MREPEVPQAQGNASCQVVIVTRHKPLIQWLAAHGITGEVIEHATLDDVRGKDVFGILPLWLAAEANTVTVIQMPGISLEDRKRAIDSYSIDDMHNWGAEMRTFIVRNTHNPTTSRNAPL
jgi:hypothetical protein